MTKLPIPPEVIAETLSDFCICYFKHNKHDSQAQPHYYVSVPISDDTCILICIITSQIENKLWFYRHTKEKAIDSLVKVTPDNMKFLSKESVVECNNAELIIKKHFGKYVHPKVPLKIITREVPEEIKAKIIKAIKDSPIVKPYIKKLLDTS